MVQTKACPHYRYLTPPAVSLCLSNRRDPPGPPRVAAPGGGGGGGGHAGVPGDWAAVDALQEAATTPRLAWRQWGGRAGQQRQQRQGAQPICLHTLRIWYSSTVLANRDLLAPFPIHGLESLPYPSGSELFPSTLCVQGLLSSAWGPSDRFAFISPVEPVSLARFSRSMNRVYIPVGHDQEVQVVSRHCLQLLEDGIRQFLIYRFRSIGISLPL